MDCYNICPEPQVIEFDALEARGFVDSGDCLNCVRCLEICPRDAYHLTLRSFGGVAKSIEKGDRHAMQNSA